MNWQRVAIRIIRYNLLILFSSLFGVLSAFPQSDGNGKISGYIYNSAQEPLAGVEVRAVATFGTYFYRMVYSDQSGRYLISDLPVGQYHVRVQNKLGYLNVYYKNAVEKSDAQLIKINSDQHVQHVNFYLSHGGFIAGQIFDEHGNKVTSSSSVGFIDANNLNSRGFINSNADGSYVSPALPNGPHIVKASSFPGGYVMTYFNNVSTQDSAKALYVSVGDTIKNVDFYLKKGKTISGKVEADDENETPIAGAWIVATEWDTGEWSSEGHSDSQGYYSAAGLRPGTYRVYVFSVDPTKYHAEYYNKAPQYENADKVFVADQDTVSGIDFKLKTVKTQTLKNEFIEIAVSDRYPGTNLTMNITGGLPETSSDDGKPILFGHPHPYTSFTTLWIGGKEVIFGSNEGNLLIAPYITQDQKGISRTWSIGNLEVEQRISFVVSEWSETKYEDTAQLQYIVKNTGSENQKVGLRILLDTMLGKDDAAPIRTSISNYTGREQDFYAPNIPKWWTAIEAYNNVTMFSVQGTLMDYGAKTPDRFSIVNWSNIFKTKWDYQTNSNVGIINDSGVALWWNPVVIEPGKVAIFCTFLGLGAMFPDRVPPYTQNHFPARWESGVAPTTQIQVDVLDDYMGVDIATLELWVNKMKVAPQISGDLKKYTLTYTPPEQFRFNDTVNVIIKASDLALQPNVMEPDEYDFYIVKDTLSPYLKNLYPQPFAENVPPDSCLSFDLFDDHSGIDTSSIRISLNDNVVVPMMEGDSSHLKIYYRFDPPFGERDSVTVRISARDLVVPSNELDTTFYFIVRPDSIAPWVAFHYPADQAAEVPLDTTVVIDLVDDFSGIDRSSIVLKKNGETVAPKISGDPGRYRLTFKPDKGFLYNDTVQINLTASDRAKQANTLRDFNFCFYTETDTLPPVVISTIPAAFDTNVAPLPKITIEIVDDKSGIDLDATIFKINNVAVEFEIEGNKNHYFLTHTCKSAFNYLDAVEVSLTSQDRSNPANEMDEYRYSFRIIREKDTTPPYTRLHRPAMGETNVLPDCEISFHILDDLSGVDRSSIRLKVNDDLVNPVISGNPNDYFVSYQPVTSFWYGDSVNIKIDAQDLAVDSANVMATVEYSFRILQDTTPPNITWLAPGLPGSHIPLNSNFIVELVDSLTGVDKESIVFTFNGEVQKPIISGAPNKYTVSYQPESELHYNQTVKIHITVSDLAIERNWIRDSLFVFFTIEDREPPYISRRFPEKDMTSVPFNTDIVISVNDDVSGVDIASIKLTVEGNKVEPEISGNPSSYTVTYRNPNGFEPAQLVDVMISCADRSNPPLSMSESYSFKIKEIYPDLFIESFEAHPLKIMVNKPLTIKATIGVTTVSVLKPIDIRLVDGNSVLFDTTFTGLEVDDRIEVVRTIYFSTRGKHQLKLVVDPESKIIESDKENNTALIIIDVIEGEIIVRSNPFTPNGDGINDTVTFNFEQLGVTDPQLKLFDMSGRMIVTLQDRLGFTFVWNGVDRFGNQAQPGVYLYLLQDQNQVIANGYVVLAR